MPAETIYSPIDTQMEGSPGTWQAHGATRVHWGKGGLKVTLATLDPMVLDDPTPGPDAPQDFRRGYWMDLDREGVNNLIRVLRRARDQACGRDE